MNLLEKDRPLKLHRDLKPRVLKTSTGWVATLDTIRVQRPTPSEAVDRCLEVFMDGDDSLN